MPSTPRQLIDQATRHAVHLERLKTHEANEIGKIFADIQETLIARIGRSDISKWQRAQAERQLRAYQELAQELYSERLIPELERRLLASAQYEAGFEVRSLEKVAVSYQFDLPTTAQLTTAINSTPLALGGRFNGSLLGGLYEQFSEAQAKLLANTIRAAYAGGLTTDEAIRAMRQTALPIGQRDLIAVTRTSLQHSAAQTRRQVWEANSDILKGVRIVATLDDRTSAECRARDGQILPLDTTDLPPFHYNCRTTTVAVLDDRFRLLDEGGTRSARGQDGVERVPANQTYYAWLKEQPAAFQDSAIGPTRGKLLRDGGLSSERFAAMQLGRRFQPLTLEQMADLEPLAFKRAGLN